MTTLMASAAVLGLLTLSPALADTIVDYSFSGAVSGQGVAAGTVAVADGQLVFDQTGRNVTPTSFFADHHRRAGLLCRRVYRPCGL